jgi:hypothetical protein
VSTVQANTPRQRIAAERARHGCAPLAAACVALLQGRPGEVSDALITVLGGESARTVLDGDAGGRSGYELADEVWAASEGEAIPVPCGGADRTHRDGR